MKETYKINHNRAHQVVTLMTHANPEHYFLNDVCKYEKEQTHYIMKPFRFDRDTGSSVDFGFFRCTADWQRMMWPNNQQAI